MSGRVFRLITGSVAVASVAVLATESSAVAAVPAARPTVGANAFGSEVQLGSMLNSGQTAHVPLCTRVIGKMNADQTAATDVPGVGHIGAVTTHVASLNPAHVLRSRALTHTARTYLFGGQLRVGAMSTHASATRKGTKTLLAGGSTYTGLVIAGQSEPASPPPNTSNSLPGVWTVELNVQQTSTRFGNPTIIVTAVKITVTPGNTQGLTPGTILIGRSVASLHNPTHRAVTGTAYGTKVVLSDGTVRSGRTAPVYLPCGGSAGQTRTRNATARVLLPSAARTGDVTSRARSSETDAKTSVLTTNRIAGVTLLGGTVKARGITTHAYAARANGTLTRSSKGTTIGSLTINGMKQPITGDPNQSYDISGVGTLFVHRVVNTPNGLTVNALVLVLTQAQDGLDAGTTLTIGDASAGVLQR